MPKTLSLDHAVSQIGQACAGTGDSPYFFMTGAGTSFPEVPLAGGIISRCQDVVTQLERKGPELSDDPLENYSNWVEIAFPQPTQRQQFLRGLIEDKPISKANLRLAHILASGRLTKLVVTVNFDDFIEKALHIFGATSIVCDHPLMVDRISMNGEDIQIIHVHGSFWFYDCCNLKAEITERNLGDGDPRLAMSGLLNSILASKIPLVVGYGGWEGDVFMDSLKRRIVGRRLPYNLFWFCYQHQEIARFPDWLTDHQDVYFVVSELSNEEAVVGDVVRRDASSEREHSDNDIAPEDLQSSMSAHHVFNALISGLNISSPSAIADPLQYYADMLERLLSESSSEDDNDIYFVREVVARIRRARLLESDHTNELSSKLEEITNFVRTSKPTAAVGAAITISKDLLTKEQMATMVNLLNAALPRAVKNIAIAGYRYLINILLSLEVDHMQSIKEQMLDAKYQLSDLLRQDKSNREEALELIESVAKETDEFQSLNQEMGSEYLALKIRTLYELQKYDDVFHQGEKFINRFVDKSQNSIMYDLAIVYALMGSSKILLKKEKEAVELFRKFETTASCVVSYSLNAWENFVRDKWRPIQYAEVGESALLMDLKIFCQEFRRRAYPSARQLDIGEFLFLAITAAESDLFDECNSWLDKAFGLENDFPQHNTHVMLGACCMLKAIVLRLEGSIEESKVFADKAVSRLNHWKSSELGLQRALRFFVGTFS